MCGPSRSEKDLQSSSQSFATMLQANYGTLFNQQEGVLSAINKSLSPTLAAGPSQQGFSPEERAALNTQAINSAGAAARNAQQAAATFGAGQGGGGTSGLTSGVTRQIQASIASQSANQLATTQNQITQADYAQGNANYWRAAGGMQALAAGYNPDAAQTGAIGENAQSFGQANKITEENNAMAKDIAGGITSLAAAGLSGGLSSLAASPAGASQPGAFGMGFLKGLAG